MRRRANRTGPLPPPLELRTVRFEDVPELLRLIDGAIEQGCRDHYDARQRRAVYASYAANLFVEALGPFDSLAVEEDGRLVGYAQLDPTNGRLRALFVGAGAQRRGIGRALLGEMEARARRTGRRRLHGAMSLNAVPFYRAAGFRPTGGPEWLVALGISIPVLRMEKGLQALDRVRAEPS